MQEKNFLWDGDVFPILNYLTATDCCTICERFVEPTTMSVWYPVFNHHA